MLAAVQAIDWRVPDWLQRLASAGQSRGHQVLAEVPAFSHYIRRAFECCAYFISPFRASGVSGLINRCKPDQTEWHWKNMQTKPTLNGIHHVTALASDPQRNVDFYAGFLGLRLVKKTVNFDAPDVYHFYYGDESGRPGTLLTFFPFPDAVKGRRGVGETIAVAFAIPPASLDYWIDRLASNAIAFEGPAQRFGDQVVSFEDPDGMMIDLITDAAAVAIPPWRGSAVDSAHAPRSIHGVTLAESNHEVSSAFLTGMLGLRAGGREGERCRYLCGEGEMMARIDVLFQPKGNPGRQSAGSIHHVAWRAATDDVQKEWQERLGKAAISVTPVQDRKYFRSIYFHEPGGVLFEIATEEPGMLIDEPLTELGMQLQLPPWLEPRRERLAHKLIPVVLPGRRS